MTTQEAKARFRRAVEGSAAIIWVRENPYKAVAIAVGVGVVLGRSRRLRHAGARALRWFASGPLPVMLAHLWAGMEGGPPPTDGQAPG